MSPIRGAVKRVEEISEVEETLVVRVETTENIPCQQRDPDILHVKKVDFEAFTALVMNYTAQTGEMGENRHRCECFLAFWDFTEAFQGILSMNAPSSPHT